MRDRLRVTAVTFSPASWEDQASGLVGWVTCQVAGLRLDCVAVRRTREGRLALSFPSKRDARGRDHSIFRPVDDAARRELEAQVFDLLDLREGSP